jgi:molybdate transport system regulatory protein
MLQPRHRLHQDNRARPAGVANRNCWCYIHAMVKLELRSSHWIVDQDNNIIFGKGRMEILESIARTGSINQTAKVLKMSYKTVWSKIKSTEKHLQIKVVHSDKKSGTHLTAEGKKLVEMFNRLRRRCLSADDAVFATIFPADK